MITHMRTCMRTFIYGHDQKPVTKVGELKNRQKNNLIYFCSFLVITKVFTGHGHIITLIPYLGQISQNLLNGPF